MPDVILDALEQGAAFEAGADAAGYLEEVGTTDLAKLSEAEWREFLRRLIVGFEQTLRRKSSKSIRLFRRATWAFTRN